MDATRTDLSFEDWVRFVFDRSVSDDRESVELNPRQLLSYCIRLLQAAPELLTPYTDDQANEGLWYVLGEVPLPHFWFEQPETPWDIWLELIHSSTTLFENYFFRRCTPHLSHLDEPGANPLNGICYMWWDFFRFVPNPADPKHAPLPGFDAACLDAMERILQIPSIACQESALHGLGHWHKYDESRCVKIIERFLQSKPDFRPELRAYARHALIGSVL